MIKEYGGDPIWFFSAKSRRPRRLGVEGFDSLSSPQSRREHRGGAENSKPGQYQEYLHRSFIPHS